MISQYLVKDKNFKKKLFYNAYIMSVFDYCCPVWANGSNSEISKVKNIKKRAAKIILKNSNGNSAVSLFNELKWLSFDNRLNYHDVRNT